jgi:ATP-dependent Lon protease
MNTDTNSSSCSDFSLSDYENDPDYEPPSDFEDIDATDSYYSSDYDTLDIADLGKIYRINNRSPPILILPTPENKDISLKKSLKQNKISYSNDEQSYLTKYDTDYRKELLDKELKIHNYINKESIPLRFKIINSSLDDSTKYLILTKLEQFNSMSDNTNGEYFKLKNWLNNICLLPINKYCNIPITRNNPLSEIHTFMYNVKQILDNTVHGHVDAKNQVMRIIAQLISNPSSHGHCIGIQGPPGIGKTTLVKEGIAKALGLPFGFIALGGATDGSFLDGHSFTYEGSHYGKIAEVLIKTQSMNPIIFFDELDKVSNTEKGEEIIGILTHLTDSSQNEKYNDKYFGEIDINLSRSIIVFSYNDESMINPILKDRMITINVKGYSVADKYIIASKYMLPIILKDYGFEENDIIFNRDIIQYIIQTVPHEEGVRNLKRGIESIVSWINMLRYLPDEQKIEFPYIVTSDLVNMYINKENKVYTSMYM